MQIQCRMASGLTLKNRNLLARLARGGPGPFTIAEAARLAAISEPQAARLLRHLAEGGWLARVQRGLYVTVPLETERPESWRSDPWVVAASALGPGYVGGWTALHHWDLTDQLFAVTVFITSRPVRDRHPIIGGARLEVRHRRAEAHFGTRRVWRDGVPVDVSDPERTLVDCLDEPAIAGGVRHTFDALVSFAEQSDPGWDRLIEYAERLGNRTVFKRLGYLVEQLAPTPGDTVIDACRERISRGIGRLDPGRPATGRIDRRWGLRINAELDR